MGEIRVTVQTEKRLVAITNLAIAVRRVAEALAQGTHVEISNNAFHGGDPAVKIDTAEDITKTMVEKV